MDSEGVEGLARSDVPSSNVYTMKSNKMRDAIVPLVRVSNVCCVFDNVSFAYTGTRYIIRSRELSGMWV